MGAVEANATGQLKVLGTESERGGAIQLYPNPAQDAVRIVSTGRSYVASVVGTDPTDDVAVLQLANASSLTSAHLGTSAPVQVADSVIALGNAGGRGTLTSATGRVMTYR